MLMNVLVTGEGSSDMGGSNNGLPIANGEHYNLGPMALIVTRLLRQILPDWNVDNLNFDQPSSWITCISGNELARKTKDIRKHRPSTKLQKGFVEHANRATTMADYAKETEHQLAIYFHDTDRNDFDALVNAIKLGFNSIEGVQGVPMVPKPTSEAWLICGLKENPYTHCSALENDLSGNDAAATNNAPKKVLGRLIGLSADAEPNTEQQFQAAEQSDVSRIDMPSFNQFRENLTTAIDVICGQGAARAS